MGLAAVDRDAGADDPRCARRAEERDDVADLLRGAEAPPRDLTLDERRHSREPFAQSDVLIVLAVRLRELGLSLMAFTGYELHELTTDAQRRLLACLDIVVTGRFVKSLAQENLRWRGSSNQHVHFLTQRHHDIMDSTTDEPSVEVVIDAKGHAGQCRTIGAGEGHPGLCELDGRACSVSHGGRRYRSPLTPNCEFPQLGDLPGRAGLVGTTRQDR